MGYSNAICLAKINERFADQLVEVLNTDTLLMNALGTKQGFISKQEFIEYNDKWVKRSNSEIFAILLKDQAIGTISLSHQNIIEHKAQVGYWIGSRYWGKGYTSQAFLKILEYSKSKGIKYLNATIKEDNLASIRIWAKNNAKITLKEGKIYVSLEL